MTKNDEPIIISRDAAWYVRSGLGRALDSTVRNIEECLKGLEDDKTPGIFVNALLNALDYQFQWLRESLHYFEDLDAEICPKGSIEQVDYNALWVRYNALLTARRDS